VYWMYSNHTLNAPLTLGEEVFNSDSQYFYNGQDFQPSVFRSFRVRLGRSMSETCLGECGVASLACLHCEKVCVRCMVTVSTESVLLRALCGIEEGTTTTVVFHTLFQTDHELKCPKAPNENVRGRLLSLFLQAPKPPRDMPHADIIKQVLNTCSACKRATLTFFACFPLHSADFWLFPI
jgi:hypothetical protein